MDNIRLVVKDDHSILVKADSRRFGKDAIMYEDISFMNCFDYIRRATGKNHFQIKHYSVVEPFTDSTGRTMAKFMWIEFPS